MKLFGQLFVAFSLLGSALIALSLLLSQYSVDRSFADYVQALDEARAQKLAQELVTAYEQADGWPQVLAEPYWHRLFQIPRGRLREVFRRWAHVGFEGRPHGRPPHHRDGFHKRRGPPPHERAPHSGADFESWDEGLGSMGPPRPGKPRQQRRPPRFVLLDADKQPLSWPLEDASAWRLLALQSDDVVIAYLAVNPRQIPEHPLDQEFAEKQRQNWLKIAIAGLMLTLILSLLLASRWSRRMRALQAAASRLAAGEKPETLPESKDEFGQLAAAFNRMNRDLQAAQQQQKQWVADAAHELRTPLAILLGEIEALRDGVRPVDAAAWQSLQEELVRLGSLIDDLHLLSLADMSAADGGLILNKTTVDLPAFLEHITQRQAAVLRQAGFSVVLDIEVHDTRIAVDEQRLTQVLDNLFSNALKHAQAAELQLSLRQTSTDIQIVLGDQGPGVDAAQLESLFDRLYRSDESRSRKTGGSGLGLSICRSIMRAHGGEISARLNSRGGLDFVLEFPR